MVVGGTVRLERPVTAERRCGKVGSLAKPLQEQTKLLARYRRTRSEETRERLLEHYLPLVYSVARRVLITRNTTLDLDDLIGIGVLALCDSLRRFDPKREVAFSVFATHRIRGAILDEFRKLNSAKRAARALVSRHEPEPDANREPGAEDEARGRATRLAAWVPSLDSLVDPKGQGSLDDFERREMIDYLTTALSPREKYILKLYYARGATMREIAQHVGLSVPRVSALHASVLGRLHTRLKEMKHEVLS